MTAAPIAPARPTRPTQSSDPERRFPVRKVDFTASFAELDHGFMADGDVVLSHAVAALSGVFPDGEEMFIASVKHYRDRITDPDLARQVNAFIGQEVTHGREHRQLNARLAELGYRSQLIEESFSNPMAMGPFLARIVRFLERTQVAGPDPAELESEDPVTVERAQLRFLAFTAALEHLTATLGELLLDDDRLQAMFPPALFEMFAWHAIEECEHKSVAFDVYRAVGGDEETRRTALVQACLGLSLVVAMNVVAGTISDPDARSVASVRRSLRNLRANPLVSVAAWKQIWSYRRRGFHPLDHDTTQLEAQWRDWFDGRTRNGGGRGR